MGLDIEYNKLIFNVEANYAIDSLLLPTRQMLPKDNNNTTECVPVPSSEHVAEIVGRNGVKIKQMRANLKTYIKTPAKDEEPVFIVTGRRCDVIRTKMEILQAADHFTNVRAKRRNGLAAPMRPGEVTLEVPVPYRVVGLVVGPRGATIKTIQRKSNAYITTPSREDDPIFTIRGLPTEVRQAELLIRQHIEDRTGMPNGMPQHDGNPESMAIFCKSSLGSLFTRPPPCSSPKKFAFYIASKEQGGLDICEEWNVPRMQLGPKNFSSTLEEAANSFGNLAIGNHGESYGNLPLGGRESFGNFPLGRRDESFENLSLASSGNSFDNNLEIAASADPFAKLALGDPGDSFGNLQYGDKEGVLGNLALHAPPRDLLGNLQAGNSSPAYDYNQWA